MLDHRKRCGCRSSSGAVRQVTNEASVRFFDVTHKVSDDFDLVGDIVGDLDIHEPILDQCQHFETIEPIGAKVVTKMRFVSNPPDRNVEMLGDQQANFACFQALIDLGLNCAQASKDHVPPPESLRTYIPPSNPLWIVALFRNFWRCCNSGTVPTARLTFLRADGSFENGKTSGASSLLSRSWI